MRVRNLSVKWIITCRRRTISSFTELVARRIGALLVFALRTDCGDDGRGGEILVVGFRRIGVLAARANIVDVEIGLVGQCALNALVADFIGVQAIGVGAGAAAGLERWDALVVQHVEIILTPGVVNDLPVVVFVAIFNVRPLLDERIEQAVVDAESDKSDILPRDRARPYCHVLLVKIVGKCRSVIFQSIS